VPVLGAHAIHPHHKERPPLTNTSTSSVPSKSTHLPVVPDMYMRRSTPGCGKEKFAAMGCVQGKYTSGALLLWLPLVVKHRLLPAFLSCVNPEYIWSSCLMRELPLLLLLLLCARVLGADKQAALTSTRHSQHHLPDLFILTATLWILRMMNQAQHACHEFHLSCAHVDSPIVVRWTVTPVVICPFAGALATTNYLYT
jgi:hypothetical protein